MSKYVYVKEGLTSQGELIPIDEFDRNGASGDKDCYQSLYLYNQEHYDQFQKTRSVANITAVTGNNLVFDLDSKSEPQLAQKETIQLVESLKTTYKVPAKDIEIYFSGMKGFHVTVKLDRMITPKQHEKLALNVIGKNLTTLDPVIYNPSRIFRLPNTRHQTSKLFKVKLTETQLASSLDDIKKIAQKKGSPVIDTAAVKFDEGYFNVQEEAPKKTQSTQLIVGDNEVKALLAQKPRSWKDYKWLLTHAVQLKAGERHNAMLVIAATSRGQGYSRDITEAILKTFDVKYSERTGSDENPIEIETTLASVFSDNWRGGQSSVKTNPWLQAYCKRVGIDGSEKESKGFVGIDDLYHGFNDFAKNFERNLIKTGIPELDKHAMFMTSTFNGLLGQPGAGKTSLALQWLSNSGLTGNNAMFFSMDMAPNIVLAKLVQNVSGMGFREAVERFKTDDRWAMQQMELVKKKWNSKVSFNFNSGLTTAQIKDQVKAQEDATGEKTRMVMIDYLECMQGPFSDPMANGGFIANEMKDVANELGVCIVMLLQTQKHSVADISDPLLSLKQIKGSSIISQACSTILTLWREGYNPQTVERDKFMSFALVKNRFGGLWSEDFSWDGKKGQIRDITEPERNEIQELRKLKASMKAKQDGEWD